MKTPVIIPAYNEAERIGSALRSLDASTVEPFVVVNGEAGARETAEVARAYTPNVYVRTEQGKLPAVQFALRKLLEYDNEALANPVLFLDADSRPLLKKAWAPTMVNAVAGNESRSAAGLALYSDGPFLERTARNVRRVLFAHQDKNTHRLRSSFGANMAVNFAGDTDLIEQVLEAPHIWPGEDRYLLHVAAGEGAHERFTQLASFGSAVLYSSRFIKPLGSLAGKTSEERYAESLAGYAARRARGAYYYFDEKTGRLLEHPDQPS